MIPLIRILLIDDNAASWAMGGADVAPESQYPGLRYDKRVLESTAAPRVVTVRGPDPRMEECFSVRWLGNPADARRFRDLSLCLMGHDPRTLGRRGWVPEIIIADYALTGNPQAGTTKESGEHWDEFLLERMNPVFGLEDAVLDVGLDLPSKQPKPPTEWKANEDDMGFFLGHLLYELFRNHPCVFIPMTAKTDQQIGVDARFLEWVLADEMDQCFDGRTTVSPRWERFLVAALPRLRTKITKLVRQGYLSLGLRPLMELSDAPAWNPGKELVLDSQFGTRPLPLDGLFLDLPQPQRAKAAAVWAEEVIRNGYLNRGPKNHPRFVVFGKHPNGQDLSDAFDLADRLWRAYDSPRHEGRLRLSDLSRQAIKLSREGDGRTPQQVRQAAIQEGWKDELETLWKEFGAGDEPAELWQVLARRLKRGEKKPELDHGEEIRITSVSSTGAAWPQRWAALFVLVKLEARLARVRNLLDGELSDEAADRRWGAFLCGEIDEELAYLCLFPIARSPIDLPIHGSSKNTFKLALERLREPTGVELGLRVRDVIGRSGFNTQRADGTRVLGITIGEWHLLRGVALDEEGIPFDRLPKWLADPPSTSASSVGGRERVT